MIMKMKKLKKGQWGFSLIELVIVIGITGLIAGGITLTIMQVFNTDARTRNDMTAVYQVRQAGKLVSQDVLQAQNVNPNNATGSNGFPLVLNWTVSSTQYGVIYSLNGTGALRTLWGQYYLNSTPSYSTKVAEYINSDQTKTRCDWDNVNRILTFTVTATVSGQSETRVYQVKPRPGS